MPSNISNPRIFAQLSISNLPSICSTNAVLESHKLFVAALKTMYPERKNMTAAETIGQVTKRLKNQHKIWIIHRLRNQIAHETDVRVEYKQSHEARREFIFALRSLL